jgi:hypothetical protein
MEQSIATILLSGSYSRLQEFEINHSILYHAYQAMYFLVYEPAPHYLIVLSKAPFVTPSSSPIQLALVPAVLIRTLIASLVFLHYPAVIQDKSRILQARLPQQHYNILYSYDPWAKVPCFFPGKPDFANYTISYNRLVRCAKFSLQLPFFWGDAPNFCASIGVDRKLCGNSRKRVYENGWFNFSATRRGSIGRSSKTDSSLS